MCEAFYKFHVANYLENAWFTYYTSDKIIGTLQIFEQCLRWTSTTTDDNIIISFTY